MYIKFIPDIKSNNEIVHLTLKKRKYFELWKRNSDTLERATHIAKSDGGVLRNVPMKAVKQPVRWRASKTVERNCFSFQTNYQSCNSRSSASKDSLSSRCHLIQKNKKM